MDVLIRRKEKLDVSFKKKMFFVHFSLFFLTVLAVQSLEYTIVKDQEKEKKKNIPEASETLNKKSVSAQVDVQ